MVVIGTMSMVVLTYYYFTPAAKFCSGQYLSEKEKQEQLAKPIHEREYMFERGAFLLSYVYIVTTIIGGFISVIIGFCIFNLKKMGFTG